MGAVNLNNDPEAVKVVVRVRGGKEASALDSSCVTIQPDQKSLSVADKSIMAFDRIFDASTQQQTIFQEAALPLVNSFCDGFNASILAYVS